MTDIGTVLGGRYRLVELLGQGGMATIYRARDNQLERDVAVKVLRPEYGADPDFNDRFRNEAQSAAALNHPNVVGVYDYGTDPVGPFIVMELVEGEDLADVVRRSGALPPRAAARLVAQAARAVGAAHDRGVVHRDIKPGNMLVTAEGRVKVADFGIARALSESALTLPGTTLGSVHYFSPEQARGELATPASDIYSLGIVLFELLTGRRPWTGDTAAAIATARLTGAIPSPSAIRSTVPPSLEAITRKALAPNPADRYATGADMAEALEAFAGEGAAEGVRGRPPAAAIAGAAGAAGAAAAATGAGAAGAPGAGAAAAGAAGGAAGLAGAVGAAGAAGPPTIAAGVARPNPDAHVVYPRDAYAGASGRMADPRAAAAEDVAEGEDDVAHRGTSPWIWLSGLLAIGVLLLAAFLVSRLLGGSGASPAPQVEVPSFVGMTFEQAQAEATELGLVVQQAGFVQASAEVGTVVSQEPEAGELVDGGSTVGLTIAIGAETTIVPDLRFRTESEALNLLFDAGLRPGVRSEVADPVVPEGAIVSQTPAAGLDVARDTPVDFVVSTGPEETPTPAPTPTPQPTPPPPPPPTPQPTQPPRAVGDYQCVLLAQAQGQIVLDGFVVGDITGPSAPDSIVVWQDPQPNELRFAGAAIDLWTVEQPIPTTCPAPPA